MIRFIVLLGRATHCMWHAALALPFIGIEWVSYRVWNWSCDAAQRQIARAQGHMDRLKEWADDGP